MSVYLREALKERIKEDTFGAESNVRNGSKHEDFTGDYETEILDIVRSWKK